MRQPVRIADLAALTATFLVNAAWPLNAHADSIAKFPDVRCETDLLATDRLHVKHERCVRHDGWSRKRWESYWFSRASETLVATNYGVPKESILYELWQKDEAASSITPAVVKGSLFRDSCEYLAKRGFVWILILSEPEDDTLLLGASCSAAVRRITSP